MIQYNKVITLLDDSFAVYGDPIAAWESLAYSDAWDKHGTISLVAQMDYFADLSGASWMEVDGRVYECETIMSEDAESTVKVTGCSLNVLFDRIVITAKERLQGRLEERIAYLVNKYAVTGSQAVTGLTIGANVGYARAMDATTIQWQTLSEFLYTQLNQRGFSYKITHNGSGALQFSLIQALDRTQDQTVNPNVQLSTTAEIEKASYKKSIKDFRNYAIVHDDDETNPQVVHVDLSNGAAKRVLTVSGRAVGADETGAINLFVMVGQIWNGSAYVGWIATSTDGHTWTDRVTSGVAPLWSVSYENGKFIAGGSTGDIVLSSDRINWTKYESGTSYAVEGVGYIDGAYFLFNTGGAVGASYDGQTFLPVYLSGSLRTCVNTVLIQGKLIGFNSGITNLEKLTSLDGFTWDSETIEVSGSPTKVAIMRTASDRGILCAAGYWYNGTTYKPITITSIDYGATQSLNFIESLSGHNFRDMAVGLGVFVAVGLTNIIAWSENGIDWTNCTPAGTAADYNAIAFDGTLFHAYTFTPGVHAYSADGKNWTRESITISGFTSTVTYGTSSHSGNLYQVGLDALQASVVVEALDGDVNQELAPEYEIDYNIGDVIDTLDPVRNIAATKRVYSVDHIIDKDNDYAIVPKLGKDFLTLRQLIAKEIKNNGI